MRGRRAQGSASAKEMPACYVAWKSPQILLLQTSKRVQGRLDVKPQRASPEELPSLSHLHAHRWRRGPTALSFMIKRGVVQRVPVSMVTEV